MRPTSLLLAAVALGLSAVALPTQTNQTNQTKTQSSVPVIRANTRAVAVDVVVTKGLDQPVGGLHKQDFQLMEDGKPQAIDFFEEHTAVQAPPNIKLVPMSANVFTDVPAAPESDSVNVLLLDLLNTDRQDQSHVHQQITNYLKNMQPGVRVAIFTLSTKLRLIQDFAADNSLLRSSLDDKKNGVSTQKTSASRSMQDKLDDAEDIERLTAIKAGAVAIEEVERAQANFASYQENDRALMTLEALQNLARYLARFVSSWPAAGPAPRKSSTACAFCPPRRSQLPRPSGPATTQNSPVQPPATPPTFSSTGKESSSNKPRTAHIPA